MVDTSMAPFVVEVVSQPIEPLTIVLSDNFSIEVKDILEVNEVEISDLEVLVLGFDFPAVEIKQDVSEVRVYLEEVSIVSIEKPLEVNIQALTISGEGVDLSNYYTKTEVENLIAESIDNFYTKVEIDERFLDYYTRTEIDEKLLDYSLKREVSKMFENSIALMIALGGI